MGVEVGEEAGQLSSGSAHCGEESASRAGNQEDRGT